MGHDPTCIVMFIFNAHGNPFQRAGSAIYITLFRFLGLHHSGIEVGIGDTIHGFTYSFEPSNLCF